jgi:preprotein translocase subunit SecF
MIDIVGKRLWFFILSAVVIIPGVISLGIFGLRPGIDFSSGTTMTLRFDGEVQQYKLRQVVADLGYKDAIIQRTGEGDFFIRVKELSPEERSSFVDGVQKELGQKVTMLDYYTVSPLVAAQTGRNAAIAVVAASVFILLYISWAFRKMPKPFRWGTCAVVALIHDVLLVMGVFSILGWAAGVQIDAMFITGMLTVVGYSVHDTIVVFDRIRENMSRGVSRDFEVVVNSSILETLARSLNTALTTLFVVTALLLFGGITIRYFVLVLFIGIITGTYSSICNASQLLVVWDKGDWGRLFSPRKQIEASA